MAHRVLRMVNTGPEEASRDFVALFILDPAFPPLRSAPSVLAHSYLMLKVLSACGLSQSDIANIQERSSFFFKMFLLFLFIIFSKMERKRENKRGST